MKQDKVRFWDSSKWCWTNEPVKYRLVHNPCLTTAEKRMVLKTFNKLTPRKMKSANTELAGIYGIFPVDGVGWWDAVQLNKLVYGPGSHYKAAAWIVEENDVEYFQCHMSLPSRKGSEDYPYPDDYYLCILLDLLRSFMKRQKLKKKKVSST